MKARIAVVIPFVILFMGCHKSADNPTVSEPVCPSYFSKTFGSLEFAGFTPEELDTVLVSAKDSTGLWLTDTVNLSRFFNKDTAFMFQYVLIGGQSAGIVEGRETVVTVPATGNVYHIDRAGFNAGHLRCLYYPGLGGFPGHGPSVSQVAPDSAYINGAVVYSSPQYTVRPGLLPVHK